MSRRTVAWGLLLAGLYLLVAAGTAWLQPGRFRPLLDGIAPPPGSYRWSIPDGDGAPGPEAASAVVNLHPGGSDGVRLTTPDGQASLGLFRNVASAQGPELLLEIRLEPTNPVTLAPPPPGLHPWSNAYQVRLAAQPGGRPIDRLAVPAQLALVAATQGGGARLLYSADGTAWEPVASEPFGSGADQDADVTRAGTYLVAGPRQLLVDAGSGSSWWWKALAVGLPVLIVALALVRWRGARRRRRGPGGEPGVVGSVNGG